MDNINRIFADNIIFLRNKLNLTQLELAEKLNYSDKAVSRWERGEAIPDAKVLLNMSEIFAVSIDDLLKTKITDKEIKPKKISKRIYDNITWITFIGVWTVALLTFVIFMLSGSIQWLIFVYALPVSLITLLVFNSVWGRVLSRFVIVSLLVWGILAAIYLSALYFGNNWWPLFLLGVPAQIIVALSFRMR